MLAIGTPVAPVTACTKVCRMVTIKEPAGMGHPNVYHFSATADWRLYHQRRGSYEIKPKFGSRERCETALQRWDM